MRKILRILNKVETIFNFPYFKWNEYYLKNVQICVIQRWTFSWKRLHFNPIFSKLISRKSNWINRNSTKNNVDNKFNVCAKVHVSTRPSQSVPYQTLQVLCQHWNGITLELNDSKIPGNWIAQNSYDMRSCESLSNGVRLAKKYETATFVVGPEMVENWDLSTNSSQSN